MFVNLLKTTSTQDQLTFERRQAAVLADRLREPRRFVRVVAGAGQVDKSTLVTQVLSRLAVPDVFVSADEPTLGDTAWLAAQWERARLAATAAGSTGAVLAMDEVQGIPRQVRAHLAGMASVVVVELEDGELQRVRAGHVLVDARLVRNL